MGLIKIKHKGNFNNTEKFFNRVLNRDHLNILSEYGKKGVDALSAVTPVGSGETAKSWIFGIEEGKGQTTIYWTNTHENDGVNVAILLIYGHGLQNGAYVQGIDFVYPTMAPIFEEMANECWKEVTK